MAIERFACRLVLAGLAAYAVFVWPASDGLRASDGSDRDPYVYLASARDLRWSRVATPQGARWAKVYSAGQALVRWRPGTGLPMHVRQGSWHGVVLSGSMAIEVEGHAEEVLDPLTYFFVLRDTRFSVRCRERTPCVYFVFDTKAEGPQRVDLAGDDGRGEPPAESADRRNPGFEMIDLAAAEWRPVAGSPGVRHAKGNASVLQAAVNFLFPYQLERGASLPRAPGSDDVAAFVLSGDLLLHVEGKAKKTLGPGAFFRITGPVSYSDSCADEGCVILSTDAPPDREGAAPRVMFPS
jgi:quercetin dioxygenase-like cupin family protein